MKELKITKEEWREVAGSDGLYLISNLGNLRRVEYVSRKGDIVPERQIAYYVNSQGYIATKIKINGKFKTKSAHRLIAEAFIPNPDNKPQINHIDNNRKNNSIENLEWVTAKENIHHCIRQKRNPIGEKHGSAVLTEYDVKIIKRLFKQGVSVPVVAKAFDLSQGAIRCIKDNRTWKFVTI